MVQMLPGVSIESPHWLIQSNFLQSVCLLKYFIRMATKKIGKITWFEPGIQYKIKQVDPMRIDLIITKS